MKAVKVAVSTSLRDVSAAPCNVYATLCGVLPHKTLMGTPGGLRDPRWGGGYYRVFGKEEHTESGSNLINFWPEIFQKMVASSSRALLIHAFGLFCNHDLFQKSHYPLSNVNWHQSFLGTWKERDLKFAMKDWI